MADESNDPILIEALRKRDELDTFIRLYREIKGMGGPAQSPVAATPPPGGPSGPQSEVADPTTVVYPGLFFGKTQPQATRILLERVRRPIKTRQIFDCLVLGGLTVGGKKPLVNLWGILNRNPDSFILVPKAGWGLVEWYDEKTVARMRKESAEKDGGEEETNGKKAAEK